jgi:putative endonuclease
MARRSGTPRSPKQPASPERQKREARPEKIAAFGLGISAESRAAVWLLAHGYRILARRWKSPRGEIDIIAAAAEIWLAANPVPAIRDIRFDAILVAPGRLPRHIPAAFETK